MIWKWTDKILDNISVYHIIVIHLLYIHNRDMIYIINIYMYITRKFMLGFMAIPTAI